MGELGVITLRPYQREAVDSIFKYFEDGGDGNPLVVIPTAGGKSIIIAEFIRMVMQQWPSQRIMLLSHVKELLSQNYNKLITLWPEAPAGLFSAGLKRKQIRPITVAGIQSIYKKGKEVGHVDLILIDESHLLGDKDTGMYRRFIADLMITNPSLKVIGFTATPFRMSRGLLYEGDNRIFTDVCYEASIKEMMKQGYLSPLTSKAANVQYDFSSARIQGGEYNMSDLSRIVDGSALTEQAMREAVVLAEGRKRWLVFCVSVQHALAARDILRGMGMTCETVLGDTPLDERDRILRDYNDGRLDALTNVGVLTTGFDSPAIDCIVSLRPTKSPGLWIQMVGRGFRLSPGKKDCLVLDYAGNIEEHGPIDRIRAKKKTDTEAPTKKCPNRDCRAVCPLGVIYCPACGQMFTKKCPNCEAEVIINAKECDDCGHLFSNPRAVDHDTTASRGSIISGMGDFEERPVKRVEYYRHEKDDKPPSLRVEYYTGDGIAAQPISEWVCLEHYGWARARAEKWWNKMSRGQRCPLTVEEAMKRKDELVRPIKLLVAKEGRYYRVYDTVIGG